MRDWIRLLESSDDIATLIDRAGFDDHDRDIGTAGFCAMFALALYRVEIRQQPTLVLVGAKRDGEIVRDKSGDIWWSHAALKLNNRYYDIDGEQKPEWLIGNYGWAMPLGEDMEISLIEMQPREFIDEIKKTPPACDWRFYSKCKKKLSGHILAD